MPSRRIVRGLIVALIGAAIYAAILRHFFISDDFVMILMVRVLEVDPSHLWRTPPEILRATSYLYFTLCYKLFGLNPMPYYGLGIALHVIAALLVGRMVFRLSGDERAGWAAALFFVAYERHQEAVMWISAVNDLLLTLGWLTTLLCWHGYLHARRLNGVCYAAALAAFTFTLFSKESSVALLPCMALLQIASTSDGAPRIGLPKPRMLSPYVPFVLPLASLGFVWWFQVRDNFFVIRGFYAFGPHFFSVFARSAARLLAQAAPITALVLFWEYRRTKIRGFGGVVESVRALARDRGLVFWLLFLLLSTAPYCFLTYLDHIPSRNTYLPSVALAGIIGLLLVRLGRAIPRPDLGARLALSILVALVATNGAYVATRKARQYLERAAPTVELITALDALPAAPEEERTVYVCDFPVLEIAARASVELFSSVPNNRIVFTRACTSRLPGTTLRWNRGKLSFAPPDHEGARDSGPISLRR